MSVYVTQKWDCFFFANTVKLNIIVSEKSNFAFILYFVICIFNMKFRLLPDLDFVFLMNCISKLFEVRNNQV